MTGILIKRVKFGYRDVHIRKTVRHWEESNLKIGRDWNDLSTS